MIDGEKVKGKKKMIKFIRKHKKAFIIGGCVVVGGALTWWLIGPEIVTVLGGLAAGAASTLPADKNDFANRKKEEGFYLSELDLHKKEKPEEKREYTNPVEPVNYSSCIVNLPENRQPSEEKIRTAAENGFTLSEGQTWRRNFTKYEDRTEDQTVA